MGVCDHNNNIVLIAYHITHIVCVMWYTCVQCGVCDHDNNIVMITHTHVTVSSVDRTHIPSEVTVCLLTALLNGKFKRSYD